MKPEENNNPLSTQPGMPPASDVNAENLAAALDNLTAAGRAMESGMSMPNLTENPTAELTAPAAEEAPIQPSAPLPGSIGSVMSAPAEPNNPMMPGMPTNNMVQPMPNMDLAANPSMNPAPAPMMEATMAEAVMATPAPEAQPNPMAMSPLEMANASTAPAPANPNPFMPGSAPMDPAMPAANLAPAGPDMQPASATNPMGPAQPAPAGFTPYNPFGQPANMGQEMAPQPVAPSKKVGGGKPSNIMTIIFGGLAALFAVSTIILAMLYIGKLNEKPTNSNNPNPAPTEPTELTLECSRTLEGDNLLATNPTAVSGSQLLTAKYVDDGLSTISLQTTLTFADDLAAETALNNPAAVDTAFTAASFRDGLSVSHVIDAEADAISVTNAATFAVPADEEGQPDLSEEAIQTAYQDMGYVCQSK